MNFTRVRADAVKVGDQFKDGSVGFLHTISAVTQPVDKAIIYLHTACCGRRVYGISDLIEIVDNGERMYSAELINTDNPDDMPLLELEAKRYPSHDCMLVDAINEITERDPRRFVISVCVGNSTENGWEYVIDYMDGEGPYRIRIEQVD